MPILFYFSEVMKLYRYKYIYIKTMVYWRDYCLSITGPAACVDFCQIPYCLLTEKVLRNSFCIVMILESDHRQYWIMSDYKIHFNTDN